MLHPANRISLTALCREPTELNLRRGTAFEQNSSKSLCISHSGKIRALRALASEWHPQLIRYICVFKEARADMERKFLAVW